VNAKAPDKLNLSAKPTVLPPAPPLPGESAMDYLNRTGVVPVRYTIGEPMKPRPVDWED
jgi:hypothetical protein